MRTVTLASIRRNRAFPSLAYGTSYALRLALAFGAGAIGGLILAVACALISPGSLIYIGPHLLPYPA